jgi:hypothetical protein
LSCCILSEDKLALQYVVASAPTITHTVMINGGLPFQRGVPSFWSQNKLVLSAALMALIALISMIVEDKPSRAEKTGSDQRDDAVSHWNMRNEEEMKSFKNYINNSVSDDDPPSKTST